MIQACIFDLDGTLLYTLEAIAMAGNRMLDAFGLPPQPVDDYRYYCGDGADMLVRRVLEKAAGTEAELYFARGCVLNRRFLSERPHEGVRYFEGMEVTLRRLRKAGLRLAVCSNKPDEAAKETIRRQGGAYFDLVQGQTDGIPLKPDPTAPLMIAEKLGVSPAECAYFGDSGTDMRTGKAAGMLTAGVLWGYRDRAELLAGGADLLVGTPSEIPGVVL